MSASRPKGITVLAVLMFCNAAAYGVLAVLALWDPVRLAAVLRALSPGGTGPEALHAAMGRLLPLYYAAGVAGTALLGLGLWRLRNGARLVVVGLLAMSVIGLAAELGGLVRTPSAGAVALTLVRAGLVGLVGWYLLSRRVREAFGRPASPGAGASRGVARALRTPGPTQELPSGP